MVSNGATISTDPGISAFSLALNLGIPTDDLPCVVVTNYFNSKHLLWFKTCSEHINKQLEILGYKASRHRELKFHPSGFRQRIELLSRVIQLDEIDLCNGSGNKILTEDIDLDFFVMCSAEAVLFVSPGQEARSGLLCNPIHIVLSFRIRRDRGR